MNDCIKIKTIENTLNSFLYMGIPPPRTSDSLMKLFNGLATKDEIIQWFREEKIKWIKDYKDPTPDNEYQNLMNSAIIKYLTNT